MRDVLTVFRFTLRDALRKKAFILTTVIVLVLIVAGCTVLRGVDMNKSPLPRKNPTPVILSTTPP